MWGTPHFRADFPDAQVVILLAFQFVQKIRNYRTVTSAAGKATRTSQLLGALLLSVVYARRPGPSLNRELDDSGIVSSRIALPHPIAERARNVAPSHSWIGVSHSRREMFCIRADENDVETSPFR